MQLPLPRALLILLCLASSLFAQSSLYRTIFTQDSLLFEIGYNNCDVSQFETLLSDDFEFYHDKSGPIGSKAEFVQGIREGLCTNAYHPMRTLLPGSMQVYPLFQNGELYGAIQVAVHRFYERIDGQAEFRSVARFDHLWLLENGAWRLKRSLSYDHRTREGSKDGRV